VTLTTVLSYWTGLAWVAPDLDLATLIGTGLLMHTCDAVVCRIFARNGGHPRRLWMLLGFIGGIWAVAVLIVLPDRARATADPPSLH